MLHKVNSYPISFYQEYPTEHRMHAGLDNTGSEIQDVLIDS